MTNPPTTIEAFEALASEAMSCIRLLRDEYPDDRMIESIEKQLEFVRAAARERKRPEREDLERINFGLLASRAVDKLDRPLAEKLYAFAHFVDHWPL